MSKLYSRARTPPSPPAPSKKSSPSRHNSTKNYDSISSKAYREYDKYDDQLDKYKRAKYDKDDKRDRYDKFEKSNYKTTSSRDFDLGSYSSDIPKKSSRSDKHVDKGDTSYREVSIPYKSKGNLFVDDRYSDNSSYVPKYAPSEVDTYSKYTPSKDHSNLKYSSKHVSSDLAASSSSRRYSPYPTNKSSSRTSYSKFETDSYFAHGDGYNSFSSYSGSKSMSGRSNIGAVQERGSSHRGSGSKSYAIHESPSHTQNYYERYVIGDSVVYGSPGRYPKDVYPPSPKSKSRHSPPPSPPSIKPLTKNSSSYGKHISRYSSSSPKRGFRSTINKSSERASSPYSSRIKSPMRRPPSPPPPPLSSFRNVSSHDYSRNAKLRRSCSPPHLSNRDKGRRYDDRKRTDDRDKDRDRGSCFKDFSSFREKSSNSFSKGSIYSSFDNGSSRGMQKESHPRPSRPIGSPKPLLSIPLSLSNVPRESRANLRETLGLGEPRNRKSDKIGLGKMRRFVGRIGPMTQGLNSQVRGSQNRKRAMSPSERKKRRPDDLRLWIESRKTVLGKKRPGSPSAKSNRVNLLKRVPRVGNIPTTSRRRLNDSTRRILNKGKRRPVLPTVRKGLKVRRPIVKPHNSKESLSHKSKEKTAGREDRNAKNSGESRKEVVSKRNIRKEGSTKLNGNRSRSKEREVPGSSANTHRIIKRPRVVSNANSLPVKPRTVKKMSRKGSQERGRSVTRNNSKFHQRSKSKDKSRTPRKGDRSPRRERTPRRNSRSPRRSEK